MIGIVLLFSMTSCPTPIFSPVDTWLLFYEKDCISDNSTEVEIRLFRGGEAIAILVPSANWGYDPISGVVAIALLYGEVDGGSLFLTGGFEDYYTLSGTYYSSSTDEIGCWSATRQ